MSHDAESTPFYDTRASDGCRLRDDASEEMMSMPLTPHSDDAGDMASEDDTGRMALRLR